MKINIYFFKTSWIHFLWKSSLSVSCLRASSGDCHTTGTFLSWSLRCRSRCRMTCRGSRVMVRDCHGCDVLGWLFIHFSRSLAVTINRGDRSEVRGQGLPRIWRTGWLFIHFSRSLAVTINRGDRSEVRGQGLPRIWRTWLTLHPLLHSLAVTVNRGDRSEVRGQGLPRMWRTVLTLHPLLPQSSRHCK